MKYKRFFVGVIDTHLNPLPQALPTVASREDLQGERDISPQGEKLNDVEQRGVKKRGFSLLSPI